MHPPKQRNHAMALDTTMFLRYALEQDTMMRQRILLTGRPGIGKTTVIERVIAASAALRSGGFITREFRGPAGKRLGFEILTLDGRHATLAQVGLPSPYRVGKYGVSVQAVDSIAVPAIRSAIAQADLIVIDEIGKMELFSSAFRAAVLEAMDAPKSVLATIASRPHPFTDRVKAMQGVTLIEVTRNVRDTLPERISAMLLGNPANTHTEKPRADP